MPEPLDFFWISLPFQTVTAQDPMKLPLLSALAALALMPASLHAAPREWTDQATGRKINAEFVALKGDQVTLSINGKEYKLPVAKLSAEDQAYLKVVGDSPAPAAAPAPEMEKAVTEPKAAAASSKVVGPIEADGSHYFYYVPASLKPGKKAPMLFYTGSGGGSAATVKGMVEGAEICGWVVACSVESKNSSDESKNPAHSENCVKDLTKSQPVNPERVYFTGNSGGARIAFINGKALNGAGVIAFIAGANDEELAKSDHYFFVSGATDYNRYETADSFSKVRRTAAYRMNPEGHATGPEWLMTEGMVWMEALWHVKAAAMTPERAEFEANALAWIGKMKTKEPYRAAWWAKFFQTNGVSPVHKTAIAALDQELSKDPVNAAYIKGIADIEAFALDAMGGVSEGSLQGHTTPEIQRKADKLLAEHEATPWIREIAAALKNPTAGTSK